MPVGRPRRRARRERPPTFAETLAARDAPTTRTRGRAHYGGDVSPIRLDQVNLVVRDVAVSRAFYSRLGLDFGAEHDPIWSAHHVSARRVENAPIDFDLDSAAFATKWDRGWAGGTGAVLGFKVDSREEVDQLVAALSAAGVPVQQDPYDAFWGARYAVVSDPDGNAVGIMSPVDDAFRSEAPSPQ